VSIDTRVEQSAPARRIEHVKAIATAKTVNEQCAVALAHTQAWIAVALALTVRGNRAIAKEALAIALAAQSASNGSTLSLRL
jgi:hypothetical protein